MCEEETVMLDGFAPRRPFAWICIWVVPFWCLLIWLVTFAVG